VNNRVVRREWMMGVFEFPKGEDTGGEICTFHPQANVLFVCFFVSLFTPVSQNFKFP
jgi:hypothetical protein